MQCPSCNSTKLLTYDTRKVEAKVVRKRRCINCEMRFYTLEQYMTEDELEEIQELRRSNGREVLHGMSEDAQPDRGRDKEDKADIALGVSELSEEAELQPLRERGVQ